MDRLLTKPKKEMGKTIRIGPGCSIFQAGQGGYWYARFNRKGNSKIRKKHALQTQDRNRAIAKAHNLYNDWETGRFDPWHHVDVYVTIDDAINHYLRERGKEIIGAEDNVRHLRRMSELYGLTFMREITAKIIRQYIYQPHLRDYTKVSYFGKVNALMNWLKAAGYFEESPIIGVARPTKPSLVPKYWTTKQLDEFLLNAEMLTKLNKNRYHKNHVYHYWHRNACELIAVTGLRKSEAERLNWSDVVFSGDQSERGWIYVRKTKTRKARKVTMLPRAERLLRHLETETRISKDQHECVLKGIDGVSRIFTDSLLDKFNQVRKFAKNLDAIGLHGLRHSFAAMLILAGVDLSVVKEELGHRSIKTTMIYAVIGQQDRMDLVYSKFADL